MKNKMRRSWNLIFLFISIIVISVLIHSKDVYAVENYEGLQIENGVVVSYQGNKEHLEIPDSVNGITINGIGDNAFAKNASIKSIVIPNTVTYVGNNAFEGCSALNKVTIGERVTSLGAYAFYNCTSLNSIVLPQNLEVIDTWTFGYCKALETIALPEGLKLIGSASFYGCSSLNEIIMPETVTEIGTHSFRDCWNLSNIQFSNQIKVIPYRAFSGCTSAKEVVLPKELEAIGKEAFYKCNALKVIEVTDGIKSIGEGAFYECVRLQEIELPDSVISIESDAFYGCIGIEQLIISNSITSIGSRAFHGCAKLVSIVIPASVKSIGDAAFEGCNKLVEIYNLSSIKLQMGSTENGYIACYALCIHTSEEESHLQQDEDYVFYVNGESCLLVSYEGEDEKITLPSRFDGSQYNIHQFAFYNNKKITSVIVPEGIISIGNCAFSGCTKLYVITLPRSLQSIGNRVFYHCSKLQRVNYEGGKEDWEKVQMGDENEELSKWIFSYAEEQSDSNNSQYTEYEAKADAGEFLEKNIFFVNFVLTLLWGFVLLYSKRPNDTVRKAQKRKLAFVIIACVQWVLISGLRADMVGADTLNYMRLFDIHTNLEWKDIFESIKVYYINGGAIIDEYEPGYILLEKLIGTFTTSHMAYKFIISTIFMSTLGYYVYKNSEDPCLSFIIYDALFYNMFSLTGYRQVVSAAIGILLGYEFIKKRKAGSFLILLLVASLFHKSTLVFVLFYFLANKKITHRYMVTAGAIIGVMLIYRNSLFNYVKVLVGYDEYSGIYGFAQLTFTILLLSLTFIALYLKPQILRYKAEAVHYYNGLILMWMMMPFAMVSPTSMRLVYDFGFVLLLLIPVIVKSFKIKSNRTIIYIAIVLLFGYFIITKTPDYQFYW